MRVDSIDQPREGLMRVAVSSAPSSLRFFWVLYDVLALSWLGYLLAS